MILKEFIGCIENKLDCVITEVDDHEEVLNIYKLNVGDDWKELLPENMQNATIVNIDLYENLLQLFILK